jgi:putative acetyltransferase
MSTTYPLRPFLPTDTLGLRELFAQSIEELAQEDYTEDQRAAWASRAEDAAAFGERLGSMVTLVVEQEGEPLGFGSLRSNSVLDMLYVHPFYAGEGVGTALADALERIAANRGAQSITADVSDSAAIFFEGRGYVPQERNTIEIDGEWLTSTTMRKELAAAAGDGKAPVGGKEAGS